MPIKSICQRDNDKGAKRLPKTAFPVFIVNPILNPRRFSEDSTAKIDCVIGVIGPSSTPMTSVRTSNTPKDATNPCIRDTTEKAKINRASTNFLLLTLSDKNPPNGPEMAHVIANAEPINPNLSIRKSKVLLNEMELNN